MELEKSTVRGLALIGSVIAILTGYGDVFSAQVTESGVEFGGAVGLAITAGIGAYDALTKDKSVN
ncbi:hypothetical protein HB762_10235 [Vibrio campbellii]|uniref:Holin n=1 Tax=Vibrio campbellii TaxID=680 RepID=A0ABY5ICF6_9VIBR|nr:hypothetical protein [Vibrio campbellii]UTZ31744.1 hypothetical protein HB762_10235 [Vibrio campbellii]